MPLHEAVDHASASRESAAFVDVVINWPAGILTLYVLSVCVSLSPF